jgi:hypothetical protein
MEPLKGWSLGTELLAHTHMSVRSLYCYHWDPKIHIVLCNLAALYSFANLKSIDLGGTSPHPKRHEVIPVHPWYIYMMWLENSIGPEWGIWIPKASSSPSSPFPTGWQWFPSAQRPSAFSPNLRGGLGTPHGLFRPQIPHFGWLKTIFNPYLSLKSCENHICCVNPNYIYIYIYIVI